MITINASDHFLETCRRIPFASYDCFGPAGRKAVSCSMLDETPGFFTQILAYKAFILARKFNILLL